jgi:hypothetical protein
MINLPAHITGVKMKGMNNRRNAAVAAKKRRRTIRTGKREQEMLREKIASFRRGMVNFGAYAFGGTKSPSTGNPIFSPKRTKFKGYMRTS